MAPDTSAAPRTVALLRAQAGYCRDLGSPFYAAVLERVAGDVGGGGPAAALLLPHGADPVGSALGLRLLGSVHALVLAGRAPEVARHFPGGSGPGDAGAAWSAVRALLADRPDDVRERLGQVPQTNEVGRAAALWGGLLHVLAAAPPMPVRLWEIGASAGLNLRADTLRYAAADGGGWGDPAAMLVLDDAWRTTPSGASGRRAPDHVEVVERVGVDLAPLDPTTAEAALTLQSYVWPDQQARMRRLRSALDVAGRVPATVRRGRAADLVRSLSPREGHRTVLWHSVMWQYLTGDEQAEVLQLLGRAAAAATASAPLTYLSFEPDAATGARYAVRERSWPGGPERVLGWAPPHGVPVNWADP